MMFDFFNAFSEQIHIGVSAGFRELSPCHVRYAIFTKFGRFQNRKPHLVAGNQGYKMQFTVSKMAK